MAFRMSNVSVKLNSATVCYPAFVHLVNDSEWLKEWQRSRAPDSRAVKPRRLLNNGFHGRILPVMGMLMASVVLAFKLGSARPIGAFFLKFIPKLGMLSGAGRCTFAQGPRICNSMPMTLDPKP